MILHWLSKIGFHKNFHAFEETLKTVSKPFLPLQDKEILKKNLFMSMRYADSTDEQMHLVLEQLAGKITAMSRELTFPPFLRVALREKIENSLQNRYVSDFSFKHFFSYGKHFRGLLTTFLLFVFAFSSFFVLPLPSAVMAAHATYLADFSGDVFILRNTKLLPATPNFLLEEGDSIFTKKGSFATIYFFDESLARLHEDTHIQIGRLYSEPFNPVVSQVEVFLKQGRLWSRVSHLLDDHSNFTVNARETQAVVRKKAAFDVSVKKDMFEIAVLENVVDIKTQNPASASKTIVSGFKGEIDISEQHDQDLEVSSFVRNKEQWISENLVQDKLYNDKLLVEKENLLKSLYKQKLAFPHENIILKHPELEQKKISFLRAYQEFKRAQNFLLQGFSHEGQQSLDIFSAIVYEIFQQLPELEKQNAIETDILRTFIKEKVYYELKALAPFLPNDQLYPAKQTLQKLELMFSDTELDKVQIRLSQGEDKLLEIQELLKAEKVELAMEILYQYEQANQNLIFNLNTVNTHEFQENIVVLVKQQVQQIKVLTALEQSLKRKNQPLLSLKIKEILQTSFKKLIFTLEQLPEKAPLPLINDLKDIFHTYLSSSADSDAIITAFNRLLEKDYQILFISPDSQYSQQIGIVTIIPIKETDSTTDAL